MKRRSFIQTSLLGSIALSTGFILSEKKTHILTLSFDDGFKKSFYKTADIYESYGLHACFNIIASGHLPEFKQVDQWILPKLMGSFDDWNTLQNRGHEVMPHSWQHLNLTQQPFERSQELITRCLDYFEANLDGFQARNAVFNFPFNASNEELEKFILSKVRAIRTSGENGVNNIPTTNLPVKLGCSSMGPYNIDHWVDEQINLFLDSSGGWLILNTHGLDDEGWGPLSSEYLNKLLKRLVKIDTLEILPAGKVLARTAAEK